MQTRMLAGTHARKPRAPLTAYLLAWRDEEK